MKGRISPKEAQEAYQATGLVPMRRHLMGACPLAAVAVCRATGGRRVTVEEVAERLGISFHYALGYMDGCDGVFISRLIDEDYLRGRRDGERSRDLLWPP